MLAHEPRPDRVIELQSLRGIMAMIVLVSHCSLVYDLPLSARLAVDTLVNPHAAVIFFFVLSGYVLQASLARGDAGFASGAGFYVRRIFRLVPLVAVVTALALAVTLITGDVPGISAWYTATVAPAKEATTVQIALAFLGLSAVLVPTVWTIVVEVLGSVYMPIHNRVRSRLPQGDLIATGALLALTVAISLVPSANLLRFVFYFALGAALFSRQAVWLPYLSYRPALSRWLAVGAVGMLFGFRTLWFLAFDQRLVPVVIEYFNLWRGLAEGFFACLLIASVVAADGGVRWLRHPRAALTGDLSFGIYLFHFPVMSLGAWVLYRMFGISGASPVLDVLLLLALTLLVVFPVSWFSYRWVERPAILAGRALSRPLRPERVPAGLR